MSTKTKTLAEGSTDCVWGTGLKDPGNMDHNLWKGEHWLRNILMTVCKEMNSQKHKPDIFKLT